MFNKLIFRKIILFCGDLIILYLCLIITLILRYGQSFSETNLANHLLPFSVLYLMWLFIFFVFDLYELDLLKKGISFTVRMILAMFTCLIAGIIFFYTISNITPKTNLLILISILGIFLFLWRKIFLQLFSSFFKNRVVIIELTKESENLALAIKDNPHLGYELIEVIPVNTISNLSEKIKNSNINTIIVAVKELSSNKELKEQLYNCLVHNVNILDITRAYEIIFQKIPVDHLDYLWFLENLKEGKRGIEDKMKRTADIVLACLILILTSPFWLLIALMIKINTRGPTFCQQKRIGKDGIGFWLVKFRSMKSCEEKNGAVWAEKNDPRITRIGKFLRTAHLDELPQMLNIIKGDISLVGPRPERPEFMQELKKQIPHYHLRHLIKPGFTGWAQIKFRYGRTISDSFEKFQYDLYYIKNRSLFLDLSILLKTFQLFFKK
ncbi:sugar transferase [Patescibacteria group bacterium]|nr:sugar transferase [Patescibacteria group bacterium]MBU4078475.1 sugar transferase [Patescibacteria group bacterium]